MDTTENQEIKSSLILMAENENRIAKLYESYASKFPELKTFLDHIIKEEYQHELWLRSLNEHSKEHKINIIENRFDSNAIKLFSGYLDDCISNVKNISKLEALSTALDTEKALIERKYFEVIDAEDNKEVQNTLNKLKEQTEEHLSQMEKMQQQEKANT